LYLDEKHYTKLVISSISLDVILEVLATPDDNLKSALERFGGSLSDPSPGPVGGKSPSPPLFDWISRASKLFSLRSGWSVKDSMISFKRNFKFFIPTYYRDISSWLGKPTSLPDFKQAQNLSNSLTVIYETRGINYLIKYLKISSISICKYLAATPLTTTQDLGLRVKLIHGLPARLPRGFRTKIREGNLFYIRVLLSVYGAYKGMRGVHPEPDLSTIEADRAHWASFDMDSSDPLKYQQILYLKGKVKDFWSDFNFTGVRPKVMPPSTPESTLR